MVDRWFTRQPSRMVGMDMKPTLHTPQEARILAEADSVRLWQEAHPDWSVRKFGAAWECSYSTAWRIFQRHGWHYQRGFVKRGST